MIGRVLKWASLKTFLLVGMVLILYAPFSGSLSGQDAWHRRLVVQGFETQLALPDVGYALALTLLRVLLCLYFALVYLLYGPAVRNLLIVFQAATAAGLWSWWDSLTNVAYYGDIPPAFEGLVKVMFGGGVTAYTMMSWEDLDFLVKGALLASQGLDAVLPLLAEMLHEWAGCTGMHLPAKSTRGQLYDSWTGCPDADKYYAAIFILKGVEWITIAIGGMVARKIKKLLMTLSSSMFAAEMATAALIQAVNDIITVAQDRDAAEEAKVVLLLNKMIITYVFFGIGVAVQLGLRKYKYFDLMISRITVGDKDKRKGVKEKMKKLSQEERCCPCRWIMKISIIANPAMKLSVSLNKYYNTVDSMVKEVEEGLNTIENWEKTNRPNSMVKEVEEGLNTIENWEKTNGPKANMALQKKGNSPKSKKESEKSGGSGSKKDAWGDAAQVVPTTVQASAKVKATCQGA